MAEGAAPTATRGPAGHRRHPTLNSLARCTVRPTRRRHSCETAKSSRFWITSPFQTTRPSTGAAGRRRGARSPSIRDDPAFPAAAPPGDGDDDGPLEWPVGKCCGDGGIAEDLSPSVIGIPLPLCRAHLRRMLVVRPRASRSPSQKELEHGYASDAYRGRSARLLIAAEQGQRTAGDVRGANTPEPAVCRRASSYGRRSSQPPRSGRSRRGVLRLA
jgi:hypothetical protein